MLSSPEASLWRKAGSRAWRKGTHRCQQPLLPSVGASGWLVGQLTGLLAGCCLPQRHAGSERWLALVVQGADFSGGTCQWCSWAGSCAVGRRRGPVGQEGRPFHLKAESCFMPIYVILISGVDRR